MFRKLALGTLAAALVIGASHAGPAAAQQKDIVDTAVAAGSFKTLAAALQAAGLVDTLKGKWDPLESTCRHASLSIL